MRVKGATQSPDRFHRTHAGLASCAILVAVLLPAAGYGRSEDGVTAAPAARAVHALLDAGFTAGRNAAALRTFYANRAFEPVWFTPEGQKPLAAEVRARLAKAAEEGLDPTDYSVPVAPDGAHGDDDTARSDIALTRALMDYAVDVHDGRRDPREADRKWHIRKEGLDVGRWLESALEQGRVAAAMDQLAPVHPVYLDLRRVLADYRVLAELGGWPPFPSEGPRRLELGDRNPQVAALRERLQLTDGPVPPGDDPQLFDSALEGAVKRFQHRHGLNEDGVVGRRTRLALGVPVGTRIRQLEAAMERWRWLPRELGPGYVLVNVPAQRLWFYDGDRPALSMRTIVGRYKRQTPTFSSELSYFVLRPKWYVPNSIAVKDLVPKAQEDPEYYRRAGFSVYDKASGEPVDPGAVDWHAYGSGREFPFRLVQRAGDDNALGNIKFMFPNPYGVYLHDTSSPRLFLKDARFFSSGCIRVEKPLDLASLILSRSRSTTVTPAEVEGMIGRSPINRHLELERKLPLYVLYLTAWADESAAYFYDDVYKRDAKLLNK